MLVSLLGFLTAKIVYPFAYLFRKISFVRNKLLWIYYDDEVPDSKDYQSWLKGRKETFWLMYQWHALRNSAWNLQVSLKPKKGLKKVVRSKGYHSRNGNYDISVFEMCVMKWLDENYNFSWYKGKYLSLEHSVIGKMFVWYTIDNTLYWRYSYVKKIFGKIWLEFQIGTDDHRHKFKLKIKRVKHII